MTPWTVKQAEKIPWNDKRRFLRELLDFFGCDDAVPEDAPGCEHFEAVYEKRTKVEKNEMSVQRQKRAYASNREPGEEKKQADLADYKSLKKFADNEDFSELTAPLKTFKADFDSLLPAQVIHFFYSLGLLRVFVDKFTGGASKFYGHEKYTWNSKIWFKILIQLSKFDVNREGQDCFKSTLKRSAYGRPMTSICSKDFNLAVLARLLVQGPPKVYKDKNGKQKAYDCSHRCHEKTCVHPNHLIFESPKKNRTRCINSDRFLCK